MLTPLAYATPSDPAWIAGYWDDADFDDVIFLLTGGVESIASGPPDHHGRSFGDPVSYRIAPTPLVVSTPCSPVPSRAPPTGPDHLA